MTVDAAALRLTGPIDPEDLRPSDTDTVVSAITRWRRSGVDARTAEDIRRKVDQARKAGLPLEFAVPFGGYKAWHQPSYPHVNWAEVMWLDYLRRFGNHVGAVHGHGVVINLSHYGCGLDIVNNLPAEDQRVYIRELRQITEHLSSTRVRIEVVDLTGSHGGEQQFRADLERVLQDRPPPDEAHLNSARRNLLPVGVEDLRDDWERAVIRSAAACEAMESLPQRREFNKFGPRIQITHIRGPALSVHLGSTRTSTLQPWVGSGVLVAHRDGSLIESVRTGLAGTRSVPVSHPLEGIAGLDTIAVAHA